MKKWLSANTQEILLELRDEEGIKGNTWPLAILKGGLDKVSVKQRGTKTIVEFESPGAVIFADEWKRPKRGPHSRNSVRGKHAAPS